jgi:hypothetical protein
MQKEEKRPKLGIRQLEDALEDAKKELEKRKKEMSQ